MHRLPALWRSLLLAAAALALLPGATLRPAPPRIPAFEHVILIVFENKGADDVLGVAEAPTFNRLARRYATLDRSYAVKHPSLPNYLALVSGHTWGLVDNCVECSFPGPSLADTLPKARKTWKTYAEGLPAPGFQGASAGLYAKKHNPFLYFDGVRSSPARLRRIVPLTELRRDLARGTLPSFALVVPDLCHGMHDCPVAAGDAWLNATLKPLLASPRLKRSLVIVTFDEATDADRTLGGGRIATLLLGPLVKPGVRSSRTYTHYSVLRTIEDAWRLPRLGHSAGAVPITGVWR